MTHHSVRNARVQAYNISGVYGNEYAPSKTQDIRLQDQRTVRIVTSFNGASQRYW